MRAPEIGMRIFVVGVPRSGTTLVQSLLAAHSSVTSFTESHFFDRHFTLLPATSRPVLTRNPGPRLQQFLDENGEQAPPAAAWFQATGRRALGLRPLVPLWTEPVARRLLRVLDELALRRGASSWVEKTPRHLRFIPFLDRVSGAEARTLFVHVIRKGLEVVASLHQASQSWERPYGLDECVNRWNDELGFSLGRIAAPNDHFVFYEELTARPEAALRRLLAGLGLRWEPEILERYAAAADRLTTTDEAWKADVGRRIRRSATSGRRLNAEQRDRIRGWLRHDLYERLREAAARRSADTGGPG
ncbi:MAG: sulfotransferase [Acidobacteriota bacterium]|nr:sulfotransferase [Acidobacteriota bacterium]MDH3522878.1 sulfotransferase [Acidobacteriota bacterium]